MRTIVLAGATIVLGRMITVGVIRNGATYLSEHLRKNDYWSEGEKEVRGEWIGEAAAALGLEGEVEAKAFEALRRNRHPRTGERLTPGDRDTRVALFDIQLSAPKDVSVLAMVGGDERVRSAFYDAAKVALAEMEHFAAVRERRGDARTSEDFRLSRNFVGAVFVHDTSRDLDPQLHVHAVLANVTWDAERSQWMALQPAEMLRASPYARQVFYRELAGRLREIGYEPHDMNSAGFAICGVEHLRERFSKRAHQVKQLSDEFAAKKGRRPTKREVEVLVRESRQNKLNEISTPEVRARQRAELSDDETRAMNELVAVARERGPRQHFSHGRAAEVLEAALRHVYERNSVAREGDVLSAALELHPDFFAWRELRAALTAHPDAIRHHGEMSLRMIRREEESTVKRVRDGRSTRFPLGESGRLSENLTRGQLAAAKALLANTDFVTVLVGDAGTGKTTTLAAIEKAHCEVGGRPFVALAPTTRARDALASSGFDGADTVQRYLASEALQVESARRVLLVDEAGLLSTHQLDELTRIAWDMRARLLLVGDTKQHHSVQRGDALRNVIKHADLPVVRLSEVLRQREEADRQFSRMLAAGEVPEAFRYAQRRGLIHETTNDDALFEQAAEHYAENLARNVDTLVVIPFWEEIERFNVQARAALRRRDLLGSDEVVREAVQPLTWTDEQKIHWDQYQPGDRLLFVRNTRFFRKGTAAEVIKVLPDGLEVRGAKNRTEKIRRKHRGAFDVGRRQQLAVSAGDRLLVRGQEGDAGFANGDFLEVARVDAGTNEVVLSDGRTLPPDFRAWTYGHALTSYRAQGSTAEESVLVLGGAAERALAPRQFYVGNTRYRGSHRIYVSNADAIVARLSRPDPGRELATEFAMRQRLTRAEYISVRPLPGLRDHLRIAVQAVVERWRRLREEIGQRMEV